MNDAMRARGVAWPRFENSEFADLVAFLYFLRFFDRPGDALRREEVFSNRSCDVRHSPGGLQENQIPVAGPDLVGSTVVSSPAALVAAMWNHAPVMRRAILQEGKHWPELSGEDLRDLRSYLMLGSIGP